MHQVTNDIETLLAELRQAGETPDQALLDRIEAQGLAVVQPLIAMALEAEREVVDKDSPEVWAPLHAARLLGALAPAEAVEPLLPLLASDWDWLVEDLIKTFGRIGEPALAPLRAILFDRSHGMWTRARAANALGEIGQIHPEMRGEVVATLRQRLVPEETQTPEDETLNGLIISQLLDLEPEEAAPDMQQAFDEDRVDLRIVGRDSLRALGVPVPVEPERFDRTIRLWLRCTACRYERPHELERVYYDLGTADRKKRGEETPYDPVIIPRRIICPKCGAVDQYELTVDAHLAIAAELLRRVAMAQGIADGPVGQAEAEDNGPLVMTHLVADGDTEMHPQAARDMYRERLTAEPDNADLRLRYGNVLRFLGYDDEAAEQYRMAIRLDPTDIEAQLNLGLLADKAGRREEARHQFERVVALAPHSRKPPEERENYLLYARSRLGLVPDTTLRPGSFPVPTTGRWERRMLPAAPSASPRGSQTPRKVGRNEPCPCGSGKKYKKCCYPVRGAV